MALPFLGTALNHIAKPRGRRDQAPRYSPERALSKLAIHRRDLILEAIARSAAELLRAESAMESIGTVLEEIGTATGVERVHALAVESAGAEEARVADHYFWAAPGISTPPAFRDRKTRALSEVGLSSWERRLRSGEPIVGHTREFEQPVREFLERGGIRSTAVVPVFADGRWRGFIAFDSCQGEREWLEAEIDTLKILAELIGGAVTSTQNRRRLADASRIIEASPTVLYRLASQEPYPLIFLSQNISRYGYSAEELLAPPGRWHDLIEPADYGPAINNIASIVEGATEHNNLDFRFKCADGSRVWFAGEAAAVRDDAGRLIAIEGTLSDVTERKHASEELAKLARTDSLTGLANRTAFLERLRLALSRARRGSTGFAVFCLDLDHFKDVNDTLGHPAGDRLLQGVATRLKECLRDTDALARFGGDEFAALLEEVDDLASIEALAMKIHNAIARPFEIDGISVHTTASIGIVPYHDDVEDLQEIIQRADMALYRAKAEGRNQYRFHVAALDEQVRERMLISSDLHTALDRREFELFYQPQVELSSGRIIGLEALIRWHHPTKGLILPAKFISIAESNGMILQIGQWVIEQACRQIRDWRAEGLHVPLMAVNVSAAQFQFTGELDRIIYDALSANGLVASDLALELTESVLMETTTRHRASLDGLSQVGVKLAIDDFGTGFSSLDYLRLFRVARLKLASEFVDELGTSDDDATIVRATIGLANALGIDVIAEGVSTPEQRDLLISAGCKFAQGYYFGRPMTASDVRALLVQP